MPAPELPQGEESLIPNVLECVRANLDQFIANLDGQAGQKVALSNLRDNAGQPVAGIENKIVMMVANIEHETVMSQDRTMQNRARGNFVTAAPPVYVNLYVLFYANMTLGNYEQGLCAISKTISYFQQHSSFTQQSLPDLDPRIDRLTFEIQNLDLQEVQTVMAQFGANYMPSLMYKVRLLPFSGAPIVEVGETVEVADVSRD